MKKLIKKIVFIMFAVQLSILCACVKKDETNSTDKQNEKLRINFAGVSDIDENQTYWNVISNHQFARGEEGYYFAKFSRNNMKLCFISDSDFSIIPVCGKAECNHDNFNCDAYISGCQSNSVWRYKDKLYIVTYDSGNGILTSMNLDGTQRKDLFEIGPYSAENVFSLSFGNDNVYISTVKGNMGLEAGVETTLRKRSLDGKEDINIYSCEEKNTIIEGVKCYGDFVFFEVVNITNTIETKRNETSSKGIYCSKISSDSSQILIDDSVSGMCIDEQNNCMYYYVIDDGLYKYSFLDESKSKIFTADTQSYLCQISFNNDVIMLSNERWDAFCGIKEVSSYLWILDMEGNVINQIPTKSYSTQFGDNRALLFQYNVVPGYITNEQMSTSTGWTEIEGS